MGFAFPLRRSFPKRSISGNSRNNTAWINFTNNTIIVFGNIDISRLIDCNIKRFVKLSIYGRPAVAAVAPGPVPGNRGDNAVCIHLADTVIISTGAAPGSFAVMLGKYFRAKTIWLDSMANVAKVSLGGERISKSVDLFLTQWPHLAKENGPYYRGSVI